MSNTGAFLFAVALIYTGPPVTQSASTIYATTRPAPASMRQMLVGIVWRTASTAPSLMDHMTYGHQFMTSGSVFSPLCVFSKGICINDEYSCSQLL